SILRSSPTDVSTPVPSHITSELLGACAIVVMTFLPSSGLMLVHSISSAVAALTLSVRQSCPHPTKSRLVLARSSQMGEIWAQKRSGPDGLAQLASVAASTIGFLDPTMHSWLRPASAVRRMRPCDCP